MKIYLIVLFVLFSCDFNRDHVVKVALSSNISDFDPAKAYDTLSASVMYQCYETLFEYHYLKRPYSIQPLLATALPKIEDGGKKYTIKIKPNIYYHPDPSISPDRKVVAQDFINQIKRLAFIPTQSQGWWLFDDKIVGLDKFRKTVGTDLGKMLSTNVKGLEAPAPDTLIIRLKKPDPQLVFALSMTFSSPVPQETIRYYKNQLNDTFVGTGPFTVEERNADVINLHKFPKYHSSKYPSTGDRVAHLTNLLKDTNKEIPFLDRIEFHIIPEANDRWTAFVNKKIDMLVLPKNKFSEAIDGTGNLSPILQDENVKLQIAPSLTFWWLGFNMQNSHIKHAKYIRQAIAHALDTTLLIEMFTNNIALRANSIYPPGVPGYDPSKESSYEYSLTKAKALMKKAGYTNSKRLALSYDTRGTNSTNVQQAKFFKKQLAKIGIDLIIKLNEFTDFLIKSKTNQFQIFQGGWSLDYPDSENVLHLLTSTNHPPGPNTSRFSNSAFDLLFKQLTVLPNGDPKFKIMKQMEKIVDEEIPWIMLFYSRRYVLYHQHLHNLRSSDVINNTYKYLKID